MHRIARASSWSAIVSVVLFFAIGCARSEDLGSLSSDFVPAAFLGALFLWTCAFILSFLLLIPLKFLHDHSPLWLSLAVFVITGSGIGAGLSYMTLLTGAHGDPPPIATKPLSYVVLELSIMAFFGAASALVSWLSLRRSFSQRTERKAAQPGATDNPDDAQ